MSAHSLFLARPSAYSRLDFRTKLTIMTAITLLAVLWHDLLYIAILTVLVLLLCSQVGISRAYLLLIIKVMSPFALLLIITHGFFNVENLEQTLGLSSLTPLLSVPHSWPLIGNLVMSREGALYGLEMVLKTIVFVLVVPLTVFTTTIDHMMVSLVRLRVPYKLALMFTATLRFYPVLLEDIGVIREGLQLRGLRTDQISLGRRITVYAKMAIPLILNAMFKSQQVEVALQARGLNAGKRRTYLHEVDLTTADYLTIGLCVVFYLMAVILFSTAGLGRSYRF
jgi:energy-coupling factor transport system permease protein